MGIGKKNTSIFVRLASRPVPRVQRFMRASRNAGYKPIFCGAFREQNLLKYERWSGLEIYRIGSLFKLLNGKRPFYYIYSVFRFQISLIYFFYKKKPKLIHASDIETMPAAIMYSKIFRIPLIYNIHDNLSQRYQLPNALKKILNLIEGIAVLLSNISSVPENFRKTSLPLFCQKKVIVVRNTPEDISFKPPTIGENETIRIFYGGWIDKGRGIHKIIDLIKQLPNSELRIAGEGSKEILDLIHQSERVKYLGILDYAACIEEMEKSHFIPAFYKPNTEININAASNKLAESLAIGRPLLLNDEMRIMEIFSGSKAVISSKYGDTQRLSEKILELFQDQSKYLNACSEARRLYEKYYQWEKAKEDMSKLFKSLEK